MIFFFLFLKHTLFMAEIQSSLSVFWTKSSGLWDHCGPQCFATIQLDRLKRPMEEESWNQWNANPAWLKAAPVCSQEKNIDQIGHRLSKQGDTRDCCGHRDLSPPRHLGFCTWQVDRVLSRQSAGLQLDEERCLVLAHSRSWWTVFPRCVTFDINMPITYSSPSCCCLHSTWRRFKRCTTS